MRKIELIELGLNEIARECRIIDGVSMDCKCAIEIEKAKGKEADNVMSRLSVKHDEMLTEIHGKVVDLLEAVGEYLNANEMVTGVDLALNKAIYDLVYERTKEEDYEE